MLMPAILPHQHPEHQIASANQPNEKWRGSKNKASVLIKQDHHLGIKRYGVVYLVPMILAVRLHRSQQTIHVVDGLMEVLSFENMRLGGQPVTHQAAVARHYGGGSKSEIRSTKDSLRHKRE